MMVDSSKMLVCLSSSQFLLSNVYFLSLQWQILSPIVGQAAGKDAEVGFG